MADANIGNLSITISSNASSAAAALNQLTRELRSMQRAVSGSNLGRMASDTKALGRAARSASKSTGGFLSGLARIAKMRLYRSIIKSITAGFVEGSKHLYEYSAALNSADSAANKSTMDQYATSLLYLKNAAGAAAGPLLQALLPVVQQLVKWFVMGANAINQFVSALQGKSTFTKAVEYATEFDTGLKKANGSAKQLKKTILGFDELNILEKPNDSGGGGGGAAMDYSKMFEEAEIDSRIKKIADAVRPLIEYLEDHFETILKIVGGIGLAMLAWKVGSGIASLFGGLGKIAGGKTAGKSLSVTNTLKGIADVALIIGGLTAIVLAYGELRKIEGFDALISSGTEGLANLFGGLMDSILPMTAFATGIVALGHVGIATVTKGIVGFAEIVAGVGVVIVALGELRKIDGFDAVIQGGGEVLANIGYAIGNFVGSLVGGLSEGITSGLPAIGSNLASFMENAQPFFTGITTLNKETVGCAMALADMVVALTAASVIDGLTSWLTGGADFGKFAEELPKFGQGVMDFARIVDGLDVDAVTAAVSAGDMLVALQDGVSRSGGLIQKIAGEKDLAVFGKQLPELGKGLTAFSETVNGKIDGESVETAANAGMVLAELQDNLPRTGGIFQKIGGEKDLNSFAKALPELGKSLSSFSTSAKNVSSGTVTSAANAGKSLAELYKTLPKSGGLAELALGKTDLEAFTSSLPTIASAMKSFQSSISGFSSGTVTAAANAALAVTKIYQNLPRSGGLAELVLGKADLNSFTKDLPTLGANLKSFEQSVDGLKGEVVTNAANAATAVAKFAKIIPNEGGVLSWFAGENDIATFSKQLPEFGTNFKAFADNIGNISVAKVTTATNAATAVAEFAKIIPNSGGVLSWFTGDNDIGDFGDSLARFAPGFATFVKAIPDTGMSKVSTAATALKDLATALKELQNTKAIGSALEELGNELSKGKGVADTFKTTFSFQAGKNTGENYGNGFAQGVKKAIMNYTYPDFKINVTGGQNGTATGKVTARDPNEDLRLQMLYGYASGGFPDSGSLFLAGEGDAPELVGTIGGRTAVANTDQIVSAISSGVYSAMMAATNGAGGNGRDIHVTLQLGEYELANAVVSALNNQTRRIGYSQLEGV